MSESAPPRYRARLRVKISKPLDSDATALEVGLRDRVVRIASQERDKPLNQTQWIVLSVHGLLSEDEATAVGRELKDALNLAAAGCRLGVDVGDDRPTAVVSEAFARANKLIQDHERLEPNVHGLAILPDDDAIRHPIFKGTISPTAPHNAFLEGLQAVLDSSPLTLGQLDEALRLLNMAIIAPQPMASLALAVGAVESMGQDSSWSKDQFAVLTALSKQAQAFEELSPEDRGEVADAIVRSHKIGLRRGVLRVLEKVGMQKEKKEWDRVYDLRSKLFHGTRMPEQEVAKVAFDAVSLAGRILLTLAKAAGAKLPEAYGPNYEIPPTDSTVLTAPATFSVVKN